MAAMLKVFLILSLLGFLVIAVVTPSAANPFRKSVVLGGKSGVPNIRTNREIQELGRYTYIILIHLLYIYTCMI